MKLLKLFLWFLWWHFQGLAMNWSNPKYKARGVDLFLGQSPKLGHFCPNLPQPKKHDSFNDLVIIHHQNDSDSWENKKIGSKVDEDNHLGSTDEKVHENAWSCVRDIRSAFLPGRLQVHFFVFCGFRALRLNRYSPSNQNR